MRDCERASVGVSVSVYLEGVKGKVRESVCRWVKCGVWCVVLLCVILCCVVESCGVVSRHVLCVVRFCSVLCSVALCSGWHCVGSVLMWSVVVFTSNTSLCCNICIAVVG